MKIYAIGHMSKGAFVAVAGALGLRDAAQAESMLRLQGRRELKIAEMESVATFSVKDGLNYERILTPRAQERIRLGEYVDGEGLILFSVGLIGVPYVEEVETDWRTDMFFGTDFFPTLRKAWTARTAEVNGAGEEDPWDYHVYEMRVLAWISIDENMEVVRTPVGPETPLEDEYVSRREPLPPPPEETYDGGAPPIAEEPRDDIPAVPATPAGTKNIVVSIFAAISAYICWLETAVNNLGIAVFEKTNGRKATNAERLQISSDMELWAYPIGLFHLIPITLIVFVPYFIYRTVIGG